MLNKNHPFHMVDVSPWPILGALSVMVLVSGSVKLFHENSLNLVIMGVLAIMLIMIQWWRDVIRESTYQGLHTNKVMTNMRLGMILFITSEVFFFVSFFWTFFHSSLSPSIEIGSNWPPKGILPFNPMSIPLLNTIILISSGVTITVTHHSLMNNNKKEALNSLGLTIILGILFSLLQAYEYEMAPFTIADSIYGSTFFITTGFHGIHVLIGTIFLFINFIRLKNNHFSNHHHFGFEAAAWYWHFVDVVWLFLYLLIYWWGNK
uniref:Cytochrome c oxidase subunit 3 n=1 Tax=Athalia icar TaxID=2982297 RepID=A0A649X0A7_9HYME|nr:cytochrome c oxidase subunit III [Athalia icar]QGL07069.1 cytochrome c oxidase subunit III [Athalia icar]